MKKASFWLLGLAAGALNGLFGSGGGVAVVPLLEKSGIDAKKSHATSIAIILPISAVSTALYLLSGKLDWKAALPYLPGGLAGAIVGALCLQKIPNDLLRRIFGGVMVLSAVRILMK